MPVIISCHTTWKTHLIWFSWAIQVSLPKWNHRANVSNSKAGCSIHHKDGVERGHLSPFCVQRLIEASKWTGSTPVYEICWSHLLFIKEHCAKSLHENWGWCKWFHCNDGWEVKRWNLHDVLNMVPDAHPILVPLQQLLDSKDQRWSIPECHWRTWSTSHLLLQLLQVGKCWHCSSFSKVMEIATYNARRRPG